MRLTARWTFLPLLLTQGLWARWRTPRLAPAPGQVHGVVGSGEPVQMIVVGDSIIAGVGVSRFDQALPVQLALALADGERTVHWHAVGRNGARSHDLPGLVNKLPADLPPPDLVVVSNGINDITSLVGERQVLARLQGVITWLEMRFPGACIVQLGLPPLGAFPALPQPLRRVLGARAGALDAALQAWITPRERSLYLPFGRMPGAQEFALDGYHPGPDAVQAWAASLAETLGRTLRPASCD
jgi:lysophospholipase L1-like esterase